MQIYKKGQGNTARATVALAVVAIAIFGIVESYTIWMTSWPFYLAVLVMLGLSVAGIYFSLVHVRTSEFLIETQGELKKVAWPPKAEVKGSTLVVVFTVVVFGIFLVVVDWLLVILTEVIHVYPKV